MKRLLGTAICLMLITAVFTGCVKKKENIDEGLIGTWDVTRVNGKYYVSGIRVFDVTDNNPTGTIIFRKNGTGTQNYSFQINNQTYNNNGSFIWEADENTIYINRGTSDELQWTRVINEENIQEATYRIQGNNNDYTDYTLTLSK